MPQPGMTFEAAEEAHQLVARHHTVKGAAHATGIPEGTLSRRYYAALYRFGLPEVRRLTGTPLARAYDPAQPPECALTRRIEIRDGVAVVFSDSHWRDLRQPRSLAHEALLRVLTHLEVTHLIAVGDLLDLAAVSRHDPIGWDDARPDVATELAAAQTHLAEMREIAGNAALWWVRGNHDDRLDKFLSKHAAPLTGVPGTRLTDHFPDWQFCHRLDATGATFTHRWHGGIHAAWNNVLKHGITIVTGDTHALEVRPCIDARGKRWGVQCGMLADPAWPQFAYRLGMPGQQAPGLAVLTWRDGALQPPELVECVDGAAWFRGEPICGRVRRRASSGPILPVVREG